MKRHLARCVCAMAWRWTSRRGTPSSRRVEGSVEGVIEGERRRPSN